MNRLSSYIIDVALKNTDKCMLIHGYTGAIDIVDNDIIDFLKQNKQSLNKILFPYLSETWETLFNRGYITTKSRDNEISLVKKMANLMHNENKVMYKNFGFVISYDCNFRCPYCYESKISEFGEQWSKAKFDEKLVDRAFNTMIKIEPNRALHSNKILLYGGEPLLKENKNIVKYIVEKGYELGYTFFAITNGYDLDSYEDLLSPRKIDRLQITIDGWKQSHDETRIHKNGQGTFDRILDNVKLALNKDVQVQIRMNCNRNNIKDIVNLNKTFEDFGFYNYKNFNYKSALTVDYLQDLKKNNVKANSLEFLTRKEFNAKYANSEDNLQFEDNSISKNLYHSINTGKRMPLSSIPCAAFVGSYLFDPAQKIYSCWQEIGKKDGLIGYYKEDNIEWIDARLENLLSMNVGKSEQCSKCKYLFLCKGGCPLRKETVSENIDSSYCKNFAETLNISVNKIYLKSKSTTY